MRSYLEIESMNARHVMEVRSDYQRTNQYSETHPDALAPDYSGGQGRVHTTPDGQTYTAGKGTGHGGHGHWLPHCTSQIGVFDYSNFDTAVTSNAGNELDNAARTQALTRSLYGALNPYGVGPNAVDTSLNVLEGQFVLI
jgi:hypothetical protein